MHKWNNLKLKKLNFRL